MVKSALNVVSVALIIVMTGLLYCSCNDDVFIERLCVTPQHAELGPGNRKVTFEVSSEHYSVEQCTFTDRSGSYKCSAELPDQIVTPFTNVSISADGQHITVVLDRCLVVGDAELLLVLSDGYEVCEATVTMHPTDAYDVRIIDVKYSLDRWGEYPDREFNSLIGRQNVTAQPQPFEFGFEHLNTLPVIYKFSSYGNDGNMLICRVLNCGLKVPVPSYTAASDPRIPTWQMMGEEVALTTSASSFATRFIPDFPPPVIIPANTSATVSLTTTYKCFEINGSMRVYDPIENRTDDFDFAVELQWPVDLFTTVTTL